MWGSRDTNRVEILKCDQPTYLGARETISYLKSINVTDRLDDRLVGWRKAGRAAVDNCP